MQSKTMSSTADSSSSITSQFGGENSPDGPVAWRRILLEGPPSYWTQEAWSGLNGAAVAIQQGRLVAFPTETVYGLGADATAPEAVLRIFAAKGRPATNPLIVHGTSLRHFLAEGIIAPLEGAMATWAEELANHFWPGPLTLVLPRGPAVGDEVTAGNPSVAIRVPDHPVALILIRTAQRPIAAPSANRSQRLSPTTADHVAHSLDPRDVAYLLDGGACPRGLESTVVDLTQPTRPRILRPGLITASDLEVALNITIDWPWDQRMEQPQTAQTSSAQSQISPGTMADHYQPSIPLVLLGHTHLNSLPLLAAQWVAITTSSLAGQPDPEGMLQRPAWITSLSTHPERNPVMAIMHMPQDAQEFSRNLYSALYQAQNSGAQGIIVAALPTDETWLAVRDRLRRAASKDRSIYESVGGLAPWTF
jgi:L-threonylcarbamoyladenylate synthase